MQRVRFTEHNGKPILLLDFSHCEPKEVLQTIEEAKPIISSRPENSLLVLTDVTNAHFNGEVSDALKHFTSHNKPYIKASAVIGITGLKQVIYQAVLLFSKRVIKSFDDAEAAKDWLSTN
ncbi:MAG: hypothetical protein JSV21_11320 [Nitrospirota bacterium]|nr:MAG: hypothetical protein JSV21_11320 [Nitrospirota bacterium]